MQSGHKVRRSPSWTKTAVATHLGWHMLVDGKADRTSHHLPAYPEADSACEDVGGGLLRKRTISRRDGLEVARVFKILPVYRLNLHSPWCHSSVASFCVASLPHLMARASKRPTISPRLPPHSSLSLLHLATSACSPVSCKSLPGTCYSRRLLSRNLCVTSVRGATTSKHTMQPTD